MLPSKLLGLTPSLSPGYLGASAEPSGLSVRLTGFAAVLHLPPNSSAAQLFCIVLAVDEPLLDQHCAFEISVFFFPCHCALLLELSWHKQILL